MHRQRSDGRVGTKIGANSVCSAVKVKVRKRVPIRLYSVKGSSRTRDSAASRNFDGMTF